MQSMRMEFQTRMIQTQKLAPRMIQSMEILQLPIAALQERIEQELGENPVLELREQSAPDESTSEGAPEDFNGEAAPAKEDSSDLDFERLEAMDREWDGHFSEEHRPSRAAASEAGDKKLDAMQNMPDRPQSLEEYLNEQLTYLELTPRQDELVRFVISHLDDNGYLLEHETDDQGRATKMRPISLDEIARTHPGGDVTGGEVEEALHIVQKLDPAGVGARDLKECLLLQITPDSPRRELLRLLIQHHLEDVAYNRLPIIHKETRYDLGAIKEAIEALHHLDPKPGAQFSPKSTRYVVPDIVIEKTEDGEYTVKLMEDWTPNLHLNRRYIELYRDKESNSQAREFLKKKIQAAKWLLESIEQRRATLEKVARAIITHQKAFLDREQDYIEPLKMQQIADQVKVHVTTVSRAVDDKWVQTPRGIFPLKRFFGGGTTNKVTGEDVAYEKIKQKLNELIDEEDKGAPLSDEDLVTKLNEAGYPVARRTVTKYRKMMKIPSSRQRKDWATRV